LITVLDTAWCYKKTGRENEDNIRWKPRELIEEYGEELTAAEIDACIFTLEPTEISPYQHPAAERVGMHAAKLIPHRLEPRHWEYLSRNYPADMMWNHPDDIPESCFDVCLAKNTLCCLTNLAHRLPKEQLETCMKQFDGNIRFLFNRHQTTFNGKKLALRIFQTPDLDILPEFRDAARKFLAEEI
jgi:hypothetical protein